MNMDYSKGISRPKVKHLYFYLSISLILFLFLVPDGSFTQRYNDAWEHTAALTELIRSPFHPGNPHVASSETSPRYMPSHLIAALLARTFNGDTFTAYRGLEIFNIILLLSGIYLFSKTYFRGLQSAASVLLILILGAWGTGIVWSNSFSLKSLSYVVGYPSTTATGLTLILWTLCIRALSQEAPHRQALLWFTITLLTTLVLLVHVLTGAVALGGAFLLALVWQTPLKRRRFWLIGALLFGTLLVEAWPYYSTIGIFTSNLAQGGGKAHTELPRSLYLLQKHLFYRPSSVLPALGVWLLALPLSFVLLKQRRHLFLILGMWGLLGVYLLNLVFPIPLGHRALLFSVLFGDLILAVFVLETLGRKKKSLDLAYLGLLAIAIMGNFAYAGYDALKRSQLRPLIDDYQKISRSIAPYDVVMTRAGIGWPLPTFSGKVVYPLHNDPFILDMRKRREAERAFFSPNTSIEDRQHILAQWGVAFLLLDQNDVQTAPFMNALCKDPKIYGGTMVLCRVQPRE